MTWLPAVLLASLALEAALAPGGAPVEPAPIVTPRQQQVRIEERVVIRVAPAGRARAAAAESGADESPRYRERNAGKCLPLAGISGVRVDGDDRLLLVMNDRRLIGAELEKACRPRDFYSGFYVERSADERLCVGRDMLHARSGASCALSRLRQLIEADE